MKIRMTSTCSWPSGMSRSFVAVLRFSVDVVPDEVVEVFEKEKHSGAKLCVYRWDIVGVKVVSAVYHTTLRK